MVNVGVIGCGYWGINFVRVFSELTGSRLVAICDLNRERLSGVKRRFPTVRMVGELQQILDDPDIDAVVISTPTSTHYEIAKECIEHDKHILVEKPLCMEVAEGEELVELAERRHRVLMVSHTFLYNSGIRKLKECMKSNDFGRVYYLYSTRTHLGLIRTDVNVVWDLAPHDVSIFNYLLEALPFWVSAVGGRFLNTRKEDAGFITLGYPDDIVGNIHVSWLESNKVREVVVVGSKKRVVFDDLNNLEKVRIFEKGASVTGDVNSFGEFQLQLRDGDIVSPRVETSEPLRNECVHFLECIGKGGRPLSDGRNGVEVVRVMRAIDRSLSSNGTPVEV